MVSSEGRGGDSRESGAALRAGDVEVIKSSLEINLAGMSNGPRDAGVFGGLGVTVEGS